MENEIVSNKSENNLSNSEIQRYDRHLIIPEIGLEGQLKLKNTKVLIIGVGGLGSPISLYLTAAGVGTIGLVEFDRVDFSNLQRQVLFNELDLGKSKVFVAKKKLKELNSDIEIIIHPTLITKENGKDICKNYDIIVDATDNFQTRYLTNDISFFLNKPYVYASIFRFEGQVTVFNYQDGPCYRCLYPRPPAPGLVPSCAEGGVLGILPGIIGSLQANEVVKLILNIGRPLKNKLLIYDALEAESYTFETIKNPNCELCSNSGTIKDLIDYNTFCGIEPKTDVATITVQELFDWKKKNKEFQLIDVRTEKERRNNKIEDTLFIPQSEIFQRLNELETKIPIIVHCKSGVRSAKVVSQLTEHGFENTFSLSGGIDEYLSVI